MMKIVQRIRRASIVALLATGAGLPTTSMAQSSSAFDAPKWQFSAIIYGYFPTIGGHTILPVDNGGSSIDIDASKLIDNLKFTFMGTFDAHNGRWGAFTDIIYLDVGGSESGTRNFNIGNIGLPASTTADLNLDLKGTLWTKIGR